MGYTIDASQGYVTYGSGTALCDANYVFYCAQDVAAYSDYTLTTGSTTLATATAQTGKSSASFGGMGGGQNAPTLLRGVGAFCFCK